MKRKPYHLNILTKMYGLLKLISLGFISAKIRFEDHGELLEKSIQPKKQEDVYFIVEELEKMVKSCIDVEGSLDTQNYLIDLIGKIRAIFFRNFFAEFSIKNTNVKIILKNKTEVIMTKDSWVLFTKPFHGITSKTPEGKDVEIRFSNIKLKDGILPVETEKEGDAREYF